MDNLIVKNVEFTGDTLVAVKDEKSGKIYTGVGYICKGIGLTKGQKDRQTENVQQDLVLKQGCRKFEAGVLDPNNSVIGIDIDFLPLWLAKIPITPKMKKQKPELTERLVEYQLKAKDTLAAAFIKKTLSAFEELELHYKVLAEHDNKLVLINKRMDHIEDNTTVEHGAEVRIQKEVNKRVKVVCWGCEAPAYKNKDLRSRVYRTIWKDYKEYFKITSYHDTLRKDLDAALKLINDWNPSGSLLREIRENNKNYSRYW